MSRRIRRIVLAVLVLTTVLAAVWLLATPSGRALLDREHLRQLGVTLAHWVNHYPVLSFLLLVLAYVVCAILLLPVWWLQLLAGMSAGLGWGLVGVMVASTCGALATALLSAWLGEDWVRRHVVGTQDRQGFMARLLKILGRRGLLVVFLCRLSYPVPYGVSNYLFGLLGVRLRDIALGTALGGTPVYAGWVAAGARPHWLADWRFWAVVIGANLLILIPLLVWSVRSKR